MHMLNIKCNSRHSVLWAIVPSVVSRSCPEHRRVLKVLKHFLIWNRDMTYWSADTLSWQLWNRNMDFQVYRCIYGNGATLLNFQGIGLGVRTYVRLVTWQTKIFWDRWVTKVWSSPHVPWAHRISAIIIITVSKELGIPVTSFCFRLCAM